MDASGFVGFRSIPLYQDVEGHHHVGQMRLETASSQMSHLLAAQHASNLAKVVSTIIRTFHWPRQRIFTSAGLPLAGEARCRPRQSSAVVDSRFLCQLAHRLLVLSSGTCPASAGSPGSSWNNIVDPDRPILHPMTTRAGSRRSVRRISGCLASKTSESRHQPLEWPNDVHDVPRHPCDETHLASKTARLTLSSAQPSPPAARSVTPWQTA